MSLELYAFIAVTASSSTLDDLLEMVKSDNDGRQRMLDETGLAPTRSLDVMSALLVNVARTLTFFMTSSRYQVWPIRSMNSSGYILNISSLEALSSQSIIPETDPTRTMLQQGTDLFASHTILIALAYHPSATAPMLVNLPNE